MTYYPLITFFQPLWRKSPLITVAAVDMYHMGKVVQHTLSHRCEIAGIAHFAGSMHTALGNVAVDVIGKCRAGIDHFFCFEGIISRADNKMELRAWVYGRPVEGATISPPNLEQR